MIKVSIRGKEFTETDIKEWEAWRVGVSKKFFEKKLNKQLDIKNADELAAFKAAIPQAEMRRLMQKQVDFTATGSNIVVRMSRGKRKISVTEMDVDFCYSKTLRKMYDDMMLNNTEANRRACLRANPDHYLLQGLNETDQEVIELTGGLPWASRFVIRYGDFAGLQSKKDPDYPYQAAGVSYLPSGLAIGAVRHQMKDTATGCHIKLMVEFPILMPDKNIRAHEYHLACEFYNWFSEIERRIKEGE
ncbi:hypothetical protein [Limosilactobacillus kribbianus]|uniref:hypothetical protein n=1 Tax=Limosilactobacillus kribbianus TaxID=2982695 RepID=UPI0022654C9B|nr:hypothetical protein [Limosilactobacillus kribbianus]